MSKVLLIDDDFMVRYALSRALTSARFDVVELPSALKIAETITAEHPDIIVTDIIMPDCNGLEGILLVRERFPDMPIIAISGGGRKIGPEILESADAFGADVILRKPFNDTELITHINALLH